MPYFTNDFLDFFTELSKHNNREWFNKNKERYELSVKKPFENFIEEMIHRIQEDDDSINITPKESIFRIYRDVRFSKDKKPYKTHAAAVISAGGRKDFTIPGFYFQFNHEDLRLYSGLHTLEKNQLQNLREYIATHLNEFEAHLKDKEFKKRFGKIHGEQNKRIPKEFQETFEIQPLIANKQFYFFKKFEPSKLLSKTLTTTLMKYCVAAKSMNEFLKNGMKEIG